MFDKEVKTKRRSIIEVLRSPRMASPAPSSFHSTNKNFCLYKKEPGNLDDRRESEDAEVVVSLVATDLDTDKESHLRRYVIQKASKNLLYKSGTINVIPRGSASPSRGTQVSQLVGFIALVELAGEHLDDVVQDETGDETPAPPKSTSREYYICFLCEVDNDHSLGLFHTELKNFTDQLVTILQKYTSTSDNLDSLTQEFTMSASAWYWTCVEYITRCVKLLDTNLDKVIYAILLGKQVVLAAPQPIFDDLAKLLLVVSIVNLSPQAMRSAEEDDGDEEPVPVAGGSGVDGDGTKLLISCTPSPLTTFAPAPAPAQAATIPASAYENAEIANSPVIPHAHPLSRQSSAAYIPRAGDYSDVQVTLNTKETNNFCTSWANQLRSGSSDPFRLRTLLEDLKLKVIQELNFIRKVIDQAKLSNYQLYKSYVVLRANSNCDVLLNLLMKDITNDATTSEVLEVIFEHMQEDLASAIIG